MADLSLHDFSPWLDQECQVGEGAERLPMILLAAEPLADSPRAAGGFRLEFLGPVDPVLDQGTKRVTGPSATYDIVMVPIGRNAAGTRYEAVFS